MKELERHLEVMGLQQMLLVLTLSGESIAADHRTGFLFSKRLQKNFVKKQLNNPYI